MRAHTPILGMLALAVAVAGCGLTDPYTNHSPTQTTAQTTTRRSATATLPNDPSERTAGHHPAATTALAITANPTAAGESTPQAVLERYAELEINWTAETIGQTQRELAAISLGTARADALQAAASYQADSVLQHSHVTNTGTVIAITTRRDGAHDVWVIVTSEKTTGQGDNAGLPAGLHVTYAQLTHTPHGYRVSAWSPRT
jgi:hypothetical protein